MAVLKKPTPGIKFGVIILLLSVVLCGLFGLKYRGLAFSDISWDRLITGGLAVYMPLLVWCLSSMFAAKNLVVQHSMNILLQTRMSAEYAKHAKSALEALNPDADLSNANLKDGVIYMLNMFEFVAIGIRRGDLDEQIFKDAWKATLKLTIDRHEQGLIGSVRNEPLRQNTWCHVSWLNRRWQNPSVLSLSFGVACLLLLCASGLLAWLYVFYLMI